MCFLEYSIPCISNAVYSVENVRVSSIMKLTMWYCVKSHGNYLVLLPWKVVLSASWSMILALSQLMMWLLSWHAKLPIYKSLMKIFFLWDRVTFLALTFFHNSQTATFGVDDVTTVIEVCQPVTHLHTESSEQGSWQELEYFEWVQLFLGFE